MDGRDKMLLEKTEALTQLMCELESGDRDTISYSEEEAFLLLTGEAF